jgi:hypothetical protein
LIDGGRMMNEDGHEATALPRRPPCVILMLNGTQQGGEAKVFPLVKAPTFEQLLTECTNRFAREIKRIFVNVPRLGEDGGGVGPCELDSANYLTIRSQLPARCVLYVSSGEEFVPTHVPAPPNFYFSVTVIQYLQIYKYILFIINMRTIVNLTTDRATK